MKRMAIFASGGGSNAHKIIEHFKNSAIARVELIVTDNGHAGVLKYAEQYKIPSVTLKKSDLQDAKTQLELLNSHAIDFIVLSGYLKKIDISLVRSFSGKIVNIHPALLPKYGGKGMYGMRVHRAVKANNESYSGPTIHLVNEKYDDGKILFQEKVMLSPSDTPEDIAQKVLRSEHENYSTVIEQYILNKWNA